MPHSRDPSILKTSHHSAYLPSITSCAHDAISRKYNDLTFVASNGNKTEDPNHIASEKGTYFKILSDFKMLRNNVLLRLKNLYLMSFFK